jgi:putative molybdopterin biosynthesis protein
MRSLNTPVSVRINTGCKPRVYANVAMRTIGYTARMKDMAPDYLTTRELAELLRIKERKVYELASSGEVPCTRATGKLLFPRRGIEAWLDGKQGGVAVADAVHDRPGVILGSQDPLLDWALKESGCGLASNFDGSLDGLERFASAQGIAAAMHLYEARHDSWNVATVRQRFEGQAVVLVEFCWRERGLVVAPALSKHIKCIEDLKGRRVAPRQDSAGSQVLLLQLLRQHGLDADDIVFSEVAYTESDAVGGVLDGSADATLGLHSIARRFNLPFAPIMRERFDLLVDRRAWFEPAFQDFMAFCRSDRFVKRAQSLSGYDVGGLGSVRFNG